MIVSNALPVTGSGHVLKVMCVGLAMMSLVFDRVSPRVQARGWTRTMTWRPSSTRRPWMLAI